MPTGKSASNRRTARKRRLCLGSHLPVAGGVSKAVQGAIDLELESLQIFTKNASRWEQKPIDPAEADRFHALREVWGSDRPVMSHDSYLINLASPDRQLWDKSLAAFRDELERARTLGLTGVVMHPGAHVGDGVENGLRRCAEGLRRVIDETGDDSPRIVLENTAGQGTTLGRSFAELASLLEQIDSPERTGVCLDSCHMFAAGYDIKKPAGYQAMVEELDEQLGPGVVCWWHLNDSKGACHSNLDRHEHIGQGEIGKSAFRRILRDERFFGVPKVLETPKVDEMDRVNLELLASL